MFRKALFLLMTMLILLLGNGLLACSSPNSDSKSHLEKPIVTSIVEPSPHLTRFLVIPGWHSVVEKNDVNLANKSTTTTLTTIAAPHGVIIQVQCQGNGTVTVDFQSVNSNIDYFTLPTTCKTALPSELNYHRDTFPKDERDNITSSIHGGVTWQAIVEIPNA